MREVLALQPVSKVVARLMTLIVENDDVNELDHVLEAYEQRVMEFHQVVRAEVTSAVPLSAERERGLEQAFAGATGKRVVLSTRVDPSIIGGIVARDRQPRVRRERGPAPRTGARTPRGRPDPVGTWRGPRRPVDSVRE